MRAISLAEANKIITGTFASARKHKAHALAAIVLDAGGRVKAFQKQDGAALMRFEIAYGKAFAALTLNRSSRQVLQKRCERDRRPPVPSTAFMPAAFAPTPTSTPRRQNASTSSAIRRCGTRARAREGTKAASHLPWEGRTLTPKFAGTGLCQVPPGSGAISLTVRPIEAF